MLRKKVSSTFRYSKKKKLRLVFINPGIPVVWVSKTQFREKDNLLHFTMLFGRKNIYFYSNGSRDSWSFLFPFTDLLTKVKIMN